MLTMSGASPTYPTESEQAGYEPFPDGLALSKAERLLAVHARRSRARR
jgi:hypothetical protein